ncbi:MAG: apolipoprotein A1/A4/E family protein [Phycisphaerae bacterium]|nr:apolipoprotein A1/A4/E family protein [Phycisphaerae bacterium]
MLLKKIRKIAALLRGQVSPVMAGIGVALGFWFGLMPGFSGLHAAVLVLMLLLNAPIGMFILFMGIGKAACLASAKPLYEFGAYLQEHVPFIIDITSKIPIAGASNFSVAARDGAMVAGPLVGAVLGLMVGLIILGFRKTWLKLESNSEKFNAWQEKGWVKMMDRIVIGKRAKSAKDTLQAKTKYVRKGGVVLAVILLGGALAVSYFAKGTIKNKTASMLSQNNGATVDIGTLVVSPLTGNFSVTTLAVADKADINKNTFQAGEITAKANMYNLSLGKVVLDQVKVSSVQFDQLRDTPAQLFAKEIVEPNETEETGPFNPGDFNLDPNGLAKLETYFDNAKKVKAWIDKIRPYLPKPGEDAPKPLEKPLQYLGYLQARLNEVPVARFLAKEILLDKVNLDGVFGMSNVQVKNLSDAPMASKLPVSLDIQSEDGTALNMAMQFDDANHPGRLTGTFKGIDLSKLQSGMNKDNSLTFESGKASGEILGFINSQTIDLSLKTQVSNLKAASNKGLFGLDAKTTNDIFKSIDSLDLTLKIVGPITSPRLAFDTKELRNTLQSKLKDIGKQKAEDEINKVIEKNLGDKIPDELKDKVNTDTLKEGLKGLFGGKK